MLGVGWADGTKENTMESQASEPHISFLQRRATRRALLGGAAAVAAAGTAVAVVGIGEQGAGGGATKAAGAARSGASTTGGSLQATPDLAKQPIDDPKRRAAHLLRRAGFGGTLAQIEEFSKLDRGDAADRLLNYEASDNSVLDTQVARLGLNLNNPRPADMVRWWLTRMVYTTRPLEERMTYIWHGLLTSQVSKIGAQRAKLMVRQNELYRKMALPRYDELVKAVSKDPAMLVYLDGAESTRAHPNENYAREQMELFTMGVGNYTEEDVRESARAFTGYRFTQPKKTGDKDFDIDSWDPQFFLAANQHDNGTKTFLGKTGNFGGDDIIDIIMGTKAAGEFICRRLFMELANYNPGDESVAKLVDVWNSSNHDIKAIVRAILVSDEFYSEASYRAFVRSPVEFVVNSIRGLQLEPDAKRAMQDQNIQGMDQVLFEPPNVAGWPGGSAWLSSSTFFARTNFLDGLLFGKGKTPPPIPALAGLTTADEMTDRLLAIFVDGNMPDASRQAIVQHATGITNQAERAATVAYLVLGSPEYQLT